MRTVTAYEFKLFCSECGVVAPYLELDPNCTQHPRFPYYVQCENGCKKGYVYHVPDDTPVGFHSREDEARFMKLLPENKLRQHGFTLQPVGGNCVAFIRREPDGMETWLSDGDGSVPSALDDAVVIWEGVADADEEGVTLTGYSLRDVLQALDNPSDEYVLLSLRLFNNLHL